MVYENERRIRGTIFKEACRKMTIPMKSKTQPTELNGVVRGQMTRFQANMIDVDKLEKYRRARAYRRLKLNSKRVRNISTSVNNTKSRKTRQNIEGYNKGNMKGTQVFGRTLAVVYTIEFQKHVKKLWESNIEILSDGILHSHKQRLGYPNFVLSDDQLRNYTLADIENILQNMGRSLKEIDGMPLPNEGATINIANRLIHEETNFDVNLMATMHAKMHMGMNG
ncbi:hypothetical protein L2E82_15111 [Cichorium intybus]|uniref:Uncharacterized protein n=1 Tax=Cichorium intybus TaxID=13427 RepID=A0ACB9F321_CICIN|nr:hypothetical protein L2E82_15111 [Cichorium intybus]